MVENDPEKIREYILPEELETFALMSVYFDNEYGNDLISDNRFGEIITSIRQVKNEKLWALARNDFTDFVLAVAGENQFFHQMNRNHSLFRYNYYLKYADNEIDMNQEVFSRMGVTSDRLLEFASILLLFPFSKDDLLMYQYLPKVCATYNDVVEALAISREDFKNTLNKYIQSIEDFKSCYRPLYQTPFIKNGQKYYLPLIHMIFPACTSSVIYRITDGNEILRQKIGKAVYENYLYHILQISGLFDEILQEQEYVFKRNKMKTLDVLCRKDDCYVLFDSKSNVLKSKVLIYEKTALEADEKIIAGKIKQVYKHAHDKFGIEYNPFSTNSIDRNNVFGVVVIPRPTGFNFNKIYDDAAMELGILNSEELVTWLKQHVKLLAIDNVENYCFSQNEFVNRDNANKYIWNSTDGTNEVNSEYKNFIDEESNNIQSVLERILCKNDS